MNRSSLYLITSKAAANIIQDLIQETSSFATSAQRHLLTQHLISLRCLEILKILLHRDLKIQSVNLILKLIQVITSHVY